MATNEMKKASTERSSGDRSSTERPSAERKQATASSGRQAGSRTKTVNLPFVTATFRIPEMPEVRMPEMPEMPEVRMPNRDDMDAAVQTVQPYLPSAQQAAYYGGLAAIAAIELIEWPVALAIGAGTAMVQYGQNSGSERGRGQTASARS